MIVSKLAAWGGAGLALAQFEDESVSPASPRPSLRHVDLQGHRTVALAAKMRAFPDKMPGLHRSERYLRVFIRFYIVGLDV